MNEVYVIAGGEWLRNNLNAIAAFMGTRTWDSIEKIALTLSVLAVAVMWVQRHNVMDLLGWVAVFVLISLLVNVRTSVQIIDNSDLVKVHRVDNVPVGLAMPLSLTTRIGHAMVASYEMIFTQPDSVTYSKTGMLFGAELVSKSTDFLSRNPEIANLFQDYVQNCVMGDIYLNHKYTLEELMASADPYTLIFSRPSPLRGVYDSNNNFVTCKDASVSLKDKLNLDTQSGGKTWHYYAQQLFGGRPDPNLLFSTLIGDSYSYFYGSSKSASQIIRQNVTINALKEGITSYAARNGDSASLVNLATTSSMEKQRLAHVSIGHVAMRTLPMTQTILTGIAIGIFPLLVLAAVFNKLTLSVLKGYVFALMWLQSWPMLYAILNSAMTFYAKQNGAPVVLSEISQIQLKYSDLASTAGYLSMMIPPLSWMMVRGLGAGFSSVYSHFASSAISPTASAAGSVVDGNYSYGNMQTENVNGFSWSTNSTTSFGQMMYQTGSGATATQTRDGNMVMDASGAMSRLIKSQPVYEIQYYGKTFRMNAAQVLHDKYMIWCGEQLWSAFVLATVVALVICLITFFVVSWILGRQGKQQSENEVTGGRQLTDNPKDVARMLKKDGKDSDIRIGDLPIIRDSEIQNFCLHGTVGAGKSEVIRRLANYARQRGDMVVIYDRSGEFVKSYYDPSIDKILNPLDARCAAWDLWKECLTQPDFDNTANTLIPMGTKEDPFWQGSGRTIFAEAAYLMRNDPNRSYSKLVDTLLSIKIEKLRTFLRNSPAANLVEEKIEKTAISIRAVLTNYVKAIRYLQGIEHNGESFTIRDWMRGVREDQKNGWLFISSNADTHASLKPVISMWLSIAIRGLLAMGENRNRRVWFFCDELPTLHKLPDLVEILPEARKFGGCYVFGIQSYAQLEDIYGEKAAATLFDVMNTRAFFRSPSHKIAEFAAGEIGEKEHLKASEQYSYGADPVRDGVSTGKDMERQTLVSYSDIQSLPDLTCYVTLPGPYPAVKLSLKYQARPKVAPEFIPRDINPEMENRLSAVLAAREAEGRQMASLFEPDVPEVVSGEDVTQAEQPQQPQQPQQPVSPAINDKKSDSGVNVPAGGIEQELKMKPEEEMEQQLPPGISESGEVVDMAAYEAWQQENHPDIQQQMQRREEVNINVHRERGEDVEPGDDF